MRSFPFVSCAAHEIVEKEIEDNKNAQTSLSEELLQEYNEIKREYGSKASALEAELAALSASAQADEESYKIIEDVTVSIDQRILQLGKCFIFVV